MAAISAAESQKSRRTFEVKEITSSADALRLIICITGEVEILTKSYHRLCGGQVIFLCFKKLSVKKRTYHTVSEFTG